MQQSETVPVQPHRKTAYVLKVYPRFSETFIVTEILAREAAGEDLEIFALRPTSDTRFHPEIAAVQAPVTFVPKPYKLSDAWAVFAEATATIPGFAQRYAELLPELASYDAADVHQAVELACHAVRRGITHLHAHFGSLAGQTAEVAALLAGIQYSVTTHAKDIFHESVVPARLGRTIARSHHVITISEYNLNHLATQYPEHADKLHLVYNGLELERFPYTEPEPLDGSRPLRIAAVGRMVEKKGFFDLVAAAGQLVARGIAVEVRIAGEGELFTRVQTAITMGQVAEPYIPLKAIRHLEKGRVVIFGAGAGMPYFSTDTVSIQRSLEIHCDEVLMGKNGVDGVYTADPRKDPEAKRFETLSYNRALVDNLAVMDASALSMARDNKKRIRVFGLEGTGNVTRALIGEEIGTLVSTAESRVAE